MREAIISSSFLILGLWCIRKLFRQRIPAGVQYGLWLFVLVRLILPLPEMVYQNILQQDYARLQSPFSVMNIVRWAGGQQEVSVNRQEKRAATADQSADENTSRGMAMGVPATDSNKDAGKNGSQAGQESEPQAEAGEWEIIQKDYFIPAPIDQEAAGNTDSENRGGGSLKQKVQKAGLAVWFVGMFLLAVWQLAVAVHFRLFLAKKRKEIEFQGQKIYSVEGISTPFLIWDKTFHPMIYVPEYITGDEQMMTHAIAHERMHQKHGDLWWSLFRNLLLTVYWFHPMVWLAARLSKTDCELYCDACVIRDMAGEREEYGENLLRLLEGDGQKCSPFSLTTGMGGGKGEMKERIRRIAGQSRMKKWQGIFLAAVVVLLVGCTYTTADSKGNNSAGGEKTVPVRQESRENGSGQGEDGAEDALTMEGLISLCDNGKLQELTYEDYLSYSNGKLESEPKDDGVLNQYIRFELYQGEDQYKVEISFLRKDKTIDAVYITNQKTGELRFLYTEEESLQRYAVDIHEFLNHERLLDSYLSYELPDDLAAGQCYYNIAGAAGGLGRLLYNAEDKKKGIYGQDFSVIWSAAGGVYYDYNVVIDSNTKLPSCSWTDYQGNGRLAAKGDVISLLQDGEVQAVSGCENTTSIQGIKIGNNALQAKDKARWYQTPEGQPDAETPENVKDLLPLKLWVVCVLPPEGDTGEQGCYVLFLNADRYSRQDAVTLAKTVHIFNDQERRDMEQNITLQNGTEIDGRQDTEPEERMEDLLNAGSTEGFPTGSYMYDEESYHIGKEKAQVSIMTLDTDYSLKEIKTVVKKIYHQFKNKFPKDFLLERIDYDTDVSNEMKSFYDLASRLSDQGKSGDNIMVLQVDFTVQKEHKGVGASEGAYKDCNWLAVKDEKTGVWAVELLGY